MTQGTGPTQGLLFALATHGGIHTYVDSMSSIAPLHLHEYRHTNLNSQWFSPRIALSPCGRWLAAGSENGSAFLYDVSSAHTISSYAANSDLVAHVTKAVEIREPSGHEVHAVDWAHGGTLATSNSGGEVRIWRADDIAIDTYRCNPKRARRQWAFTTDVTEEMKKTKESPSG